MFECNISGIRFWGTPGGVSCLTGGELGELSLGSKARGLGVHLRGFARGDLLVDALELLADLLSNSTRAGDGCSVAVLFSHVKDGARHDREEKELTLELMPTTSLVTPLARRF